ncbi:MAG: hypothetical protein WD648_02870 [Planctomycetaceae bacterium]
MDTGLKVLGTLGLAAVLATVWRAKREVAATTLKDAWWWLMAASLLWTGAWFISSIWDGSDRAIADRIWYAIAVVMLCPPVAVLGARRPIVRVWTWFVLLPLLLVLGLPLAVGWGSGPPYPPLELELPATLGCVLVLVMGAGNYFGTRFTLASLLFATSLLLLVVPLSAVVPDVGLSPERARMWATVAIGSAAMSARHQSSRDGSMRNPLDRLWLDFRDSFGIVWAKRLQDRINQTARDERWPVRLEMHELVESQSGETPLPSREGLGDFGELSRVEGQSLQSTHPISNFTREPVGSSKATSRQSAQVEHTFRWLLRRFVESEWIDARLQRAASLPGETGGEPKGSTPATHS